LPERFNGETYRGINILMLWAAAMSKGYNSARWMTFNQAKELGQAHPSNSYQQQAEQNFEHEAVVER